MVQMVKVRKGICDMEMYVGLTDYDWFTFQVEQKYDEVNFWKPGIKKEFKALQPNSLFLFKLKKPYDAIVGGAIMLDILKCHVIVPGIYFWKKMV